MLNGQEVNELMALKPDLVKQTYDQISQIDHDSHFVKSRQATINIGTIGHVSHGKTTVVKAISGTDTIKFKDEMKHNYSTIKLGYANAKIYKCPKCPAPDCYKSFASDKADLVLCSNKPTDENGDTIEADKPCGTPLELQRHVSFVDCPGHDILMATMLTGAAVMDAALLLISSNATCPQPQTSEHLLAVDILQLNHIIILQNKIDLVFAQQGAAKTNYDQIKAFMKGTNAADSPVIPISAQYKYNIDVLLEYICSYIPPPIRDYSSSPRFMVIRSFDVNKPGWSISQLKGGVVGGSTLKGVLKIGDEIEMRPGYVKKDAKTGGSTWTSIRSRVISLNAEKNELLYAIPGGLIGVGLKIDPNHSRSDKLVGQVLGVSSDLPPVYEELEISYSLMQRLAGIRTKGMDDSSNKVRKIDKGEKLVVNVGSCSIGCIVNSCSSKNKTLKVQLAKPVCTNVGDKVALSRSINRKLRLIGWGKITKGKTYAT